MKTVLITGACSGIGLAAAAFLAEKGCRVFGTTRSLEKRKEIVDRLKSRFDDRIDILEMDITGEKSVYGGVEYILHKAGKLDILVCNAGFSVYGSIEEVPIELAEKQFDVTLFGHLRTIQSVLPLMRKQKSGCIILITSMGGLVSIPFSFHYSAAKHAIDALTEGLRIELYGTGIKVSSVRPGFIRTGIARHFIQHIPEDSPYKSTITRTLDKATSDIEHGLDPQRVAKKIYTIIQKKEPKACYVVADMTLHIMSLLIKLLPRSLKEKMIRMSLHMK